MAPVPPRLEGRGAAKQRVAAAQRRAGQRQPPQGERSPPPLPAETLIDPGGRGGEESRGQAHVGKGLFIQQT